MDHQDEIDEQISDSIINNVTPIHEIRVEPQEPETSSKELLGWFSYAWASEVYPVVCITNFIPILLQDLSGSVSITMYVLAASVLTQCIVLVSMSTMADHGQRKGYLLLFGIVGALATISFIFLGDNNYILGALLTILSNVCFGTSIVLLNGYLPVLVRNHPLIRQESAAYIDEDDVLAESEEQGLLGDNNSSFKDNKREEVIAQISTKLSSRGVAVGYLGGVILLLVCLFQMFAMKGSSYALRLCISEAGIWWLIFTIPMALFLLPRPGPPLKLQHGYAWEWVGYLAYSWTKLGHTLKEVWQLKNTVSFLIAWSLLGDGFTTISSTAILFGKTELKMPSSSLALVGLLTVVSGIGSAVLLPPLQRRVFSQKGMLLVLIGMACVIPIYGILGFLPFFRESGFGGLTTPAEMYVLAVWFGLTYGSVQALMRSIYASLIPLGAEVRYFMLYSVSDKGSSFIGPMVTGYITGATGNIRFAFVFLIFMLAIPMPILRYSVNIGKGQKEARELSRLVNL